MTVKLASTIESRTLSVSDIDRNSEEDEDKPLTGTMLALLAQPDLSSRMINFDLVRSYKSKTIGNGEE